MTKRIVILGAGIGGISAANVLAKRLGRKHEILLVDQSDRYEFSPSYLWVMNGTRELSQITVPISRVARKGVAFRRSTVHAIDPANRTVSTDTGIIEADRLLVALGAATHMSGLEDVAAAGHNLYSAAGVQAIRKLGAQAAGKRIAVLVCSMPFKCPAAPYEAAMLWQASLKKYGAGTQISIYTPEPGPMPVAGEKVSAKLVDVLATKGIRYFPKHSIKGLRSARQLEFGDSQGEFDHLAYVPRHKVPGLLVDAGLAPDAGWVAVDRNTMQTKFPGVYAVGDCVGIPLANGKALPKAGVFAHGQAEVAAGNIADEIEGNVASHQFTGHGQCFVEMGGIIASRGAGNFYAEPNPDVRLAMPGPWNHMGKVLFEKYWLNLMY